MMKIFKSVIILLLVVLSFSIVFLSAASNSNEGNKGKEGKETKGRLHRSQEGHKNFSLARSSDSLSPPYNQQQSGKARAGGDESNIELIYDRGDNSINNFLNLAGGVQRREEPIPLEANHRYGNSHFELEDTSTANTWIPLSETIGIIWRSITSDSLGINLAAGSSNLGIQYSRNSGSSWFVATGAPTTGFSWGAIASSSTGQFVASGSSGGLYSSIDYGHSFMQRASYGANGFSLGSIAMSSDGTKIIAAVYGLGINLYSLNTSTGAVTPIISTLTSVNSVSVTNVGSVSSDSSFTTLSFGVSSGGIYYSNNGGATWAISNAPIYVNNWYSITSSANGKYLAASKQGQGIYYSQNNGATWAQSNAPTSCDLTGISSSASGKTMAMAFFNSDKIYLSYDYGQTWQASTSISTLWYGTAISDDGGTIFGIDSSGTGIHKSYAVPSSQPSRQPSSKPSYYTVAFSTSNTWIGPQSGISGPTSGMDVITSDSKGVNLAAGASGSVGLMYSRDGGSSWYASTGGYPLAANSYYWGSIASSSNGQFVVVGNQYCPSSCAGQLWTSINYGQSFELGTSYSIAGDYLTVGLAISFDGTKVLAAVYGVGVIRYTLNTGTGVISPLSSALTSVNSVSVLYARCATSDSLFSKLAFGTNGNGGISYSVDGGSSWTLSNAPASGYNWLVIKSSANGQYLTAGTQFHGVYYSQDSGATWVQSNANTPTVLVGGLASSASGRIMAATISGGVYPIYLSYNYGQSWQASTSISTTWSRVAISDDGGTIYGTAGSIYMSVSMPTSQPSMQPSCQPSFQPSMQPISHPSKQPSGQPSRQPNLKPSSQPSRKPSRQPSMKPSGQPSSQPSSRPVIQPSCQPSFGPSQQPSSRPSWQPTQQPSMKPSLQPITRPSTQPSCYPTMQPSRQPFSYPSGQPTRRPSIQPSMQPNMNPSSQPSFQPSRFPSRQPSSQPFSPPSKQPNMKPTSQPSIQPSRKPSSLPSSLPSGRPTQQPSSQPSYQPSPQPSSQPTNQPSLQPYGKPSLQPSLKPTRQPTLQPSSYPSMMPTMQPACQPSSQPSSQPSFWPSSQPSIQPSSWPSFQPSSQPSLQPALDPSSQPSTRPSSQPSGQPSSQPSSNPSSQPLSHPSRQPSRQPTLQPAVQPTSRPSCQPYSKPSCEPSIKPSSQPSLQPSSLPSFFPTCQPSRQPSRQPSSNPSNPSSQPSQKPSSQPSRQPSCFPTTQPSVNPIGPSTQPTSQPTRQPSSQPSTKPYILPSAQPSLQPSSFPSRRPSTHPSYQPSANPSQPSSQPTIKPSMQPSLQPSIPPTQQPSQQPSNHPTTLPSTRPSSQPSSTPTFQPSSKPTRQPTNQPSRQPSNQPTSNPSNPSSEPSMQPSSQPSSAPSEFPNIWIVNVTRFDDDYFDPGASSDVKAVDFDLYCTNENWRTTGPTNNCTLRLAIYYCLFRFPWSSSGNNPTSLFSRCNIVIPPDTLIQFNKSFAFTESRFQDYKYKIRISFDFQQSVYLITNFLHFDFGLKGKSIVSLTFKGANFQQLHFTKSSSDSSGSSTTATTSTSSGSNDASVAAFRLANLEGVYFADVTLEQVSLALHNITIVNISNALISNVRRHHHHQPIHEVYAVNIRDSSYLHIVNTSFKSNEAGALLVANGLVLTVKGCYFSNNTAAFGSAMYLSKVRSSVIASSSFIANIAYQAGTVYWLYDTTSKSMSPPPSVTSDNMWNDNIATYYGNKTASSFCGNSCLRFSPSDIQVIDYSNISLPSLITVDIVDYYGSIISYYNGNRVRLSANQELSNCGGLLGSDQVIRHDAAVVDKANNLNYMHFYLKNGSTVFSNVGVSCLPSGYMSLEFAVSLSAPYDAFKDRVDVYSSNLPIAFRNCIRGEIFDLFSVTQSTCSKCLGCYSLNENVNFGSVGTSCLPCPSGALLCEGDQIYLYPGTWRPNADTTMIYTCQSIYACIGGNTSGFSGCNIGYIGPLCGVCAKDYYLSDSKQCESCQFEKQSILQSFGYLLCLCLFVAGTAKLLRDKFHIDMKEYLSDDFFTSIVSGIVSSYQIIVLGMGSTSALKSLTRFSKLAGVFKLLSLNLASIFSLPCFFEYNYYSSLKFTLLIPFSICSLFVVLALLSRSAEARNRYYTMLINVLCFFIPISSSASFQFFQCADGGDGELYLVSDLSIKCSGALYEYYRKWAVAGVLVYTTGIPILFLYLLYNRRSLIARKVLIDNYRSVLSHPEFAHMKFSLYYELLPPLDGLYLRSKAEYWWFNTFNIIISIFLTSVVTFLFKEDNTRLLVSIAVLLYSYRFQCRWNLYSYDLDNRFSIWSTFQLVLLYMSLYVRVNLGLGLDERKYAMLDVMMVSLNSFIIILAVYYIYKHFKDEEETKERKKKMKMKKTTMMMIVNKKQKSQTIVDNLSSKDDDDDDNDDDDDDDDDNCDRVCSGNNEIIKAKEAEDDCGEGEEADEDLFKTLGFDLDYMSFDDLRGVGTRDLLTVMGVLYLRLAPRGTYTNLKKKYRDAGSIVDSLHATYALPSLYFVSYGDASDVGVNGLRAVTIFSQSRLPGEKMAHLLCRWGGGGVGIFSSSVFANLGHYISIKYRSVNASNKLNPNADTILQELQQHNNSNIIMNDLLRSLESSKPIAATKATTTTVTTVTAQALLLDRGGKRRRSSRRRRSSKGEVDMHSNYEEEYNPPYKPNKVIDDSSMSSIISVSNDVGRPYSFAVSYTGSFDVILEDNTAKLHQMAHLSTTDNRTIYNYVDKGDDSDVDKGDDSDESDDIEGSDDDDSLFNPDLGD